MTFLEALAVQRWDDHRYYHHSRVNQALHLFSALSFLTAYVLIWFDATAAVFIAWVLAMPSRQIGHFFFEPRDYDEANQTTHDHKEEIKVGYNLRRKVFLMSAWAGAPLLLLADPTLFGVLPNPSDWRGVAGNIASIWLIISVTALLGRTLQLCIIRDVQTGVVWCTKILTDPFHDVMLYHRSPIYLLRGELFDPIVGHPAVPAASPAGSAD
jgi:hypothetical protein